MSSKVDHKGINKHQCFSRFVVAKAGRFLAFEEYWRAGGFLMLLNLACHIPANDSSEQTGHSTSDAGESSTNPTSTSEPSPDSPSLSNSSTSAEETSADGEDTSEQSEESTDEDSSTSSTISTSSDAEEGSGPTSQDSSSSITDGTVTSDSNSDDNDSETSSEDETGSDDNVRLDEYEAKSAPFYVQGSGGDNLSGIAWNPDTQTYFSVINNVGTIYELQKDLRQSIRKIQFDGPDRDIESIRYLGSDRYAIVSEINAVFILTIKPGASTAGADSQTITFAARPEVANHGAEGIAIDLEFGENGRFWAVQENLPMKIYQFDRPGDDLDHSFLDNLEVVEPFDPVQKFTIQEMSDVTFDPRTGHLLVLSHEQSCIIEVDPNHGKTLAKLELPTEINGFPSQWEGISIGPDFELALVSESSGDHENRAQIYRWIQ